MIICEQIYFESYEVMRFYNNANLWNNNGDIKTNCTTKDYVNKKGSL